MNVQNVNRGGAPVGFLSELSQIEASVVIYMRLWCDGKAAQQAVWNDFASNLGTDRGRKAIGSLEQLFGLCAKHGRRPMMRHSVNCKCLGADESCFANFVRAATEGEHEDALLIATLLVRADFAPLITSLASDVGLALKQMALRHSGPVHDTHSTHPTLH